MSAKKKKKYNSRFPPARVKKIMQSDEEIGKVAAAVPVIISRSLELFVESLVRRAHEITSGRGARTLTPSHIKLCVQSEAKFDFLKDLVVGIQDLQGDMDEQPQTPIVSPRDNPLRSTFAPNEAIAKPHTLPRQISTFKPRAVKRSHDVKAKKTESICSNPDDVEQKVGKKRGRKKKEKITKFVDDMEVVEQQVLNGNVHSGDLPKILNGSSSSSRNHLMLEGPNHLDVKEPTPELTISPLFVACSKPSANLNKNSSAQAAPRPNHIPPCLATATAVAALKPSVARGNGQAMVRRSELVNTIGGVSFSLSYTLPSATASTPTFTTTNSSCQSLVKQSSDACVSNFSKIHETPSNLMSEKLSKTTSWSFAENLDEDYDS